MPRQENSVLKLLTPSQWDLLKSSGLFSGSEDDQRDGFIHLSFDMQSERTWRKHFDGQAEVVVLVLDRSRLAAELRLEMSGSQKLYPHLYRPLLLSDVLSHQPASVFFAP